MVTMPGARSLKVAVDTGLDSEMRRCEDYRNIITCKVWP